MKRLEGDMNYWMKSKDNYQSLIKDIGEGLVSIKNEFFT
jgi:hypothetical protein